MRGTPDGTTSLYAYRGIIPAYAGNTTLFLASFINCKDHPRVCGEHTVVEFRGTFAEGSSPRMRGTPQIGGVIVAIQGIIPAYAGNTH